MSGEVSIKSAPPDRGEPWVLDVADLSIVQSDSGREFVRGAGLRVAPSEIVGFIGESGSGKSLTASALVDLLPAGFARSSTRLVRGGRSEGAGQRYLGDVAMIFQDPRSALNPTMPVVSQVARIARRRDGLHRRTARLRAIDLLVQVGVLRTGELGRRLYPHQLSGGMCQRVCIAMALAQRPDLLIADEATTGLDVTVQAQILKLLASLASTEGFGILLITHDLGVVAQVCDRVYVIYGGQVMESGLTSSILSAPKHPYTQELVGDGSSLAVALAPPDLGFEGCRFYARCPLASEVCLQAPLMKVHGDHRVACHKVVEGPSC